METTDKNVKLTLDLTDLALHTLRERALGYWVSLTPLAANTARAALLACGGSGARQLYAAAHRTEGPEMPDRWVPLSASEIYALGVNPAEEFLATAPHLVSVSFNAHDKLRSHPLQIASTYLHYSQDVEAAKRCVEAYLVWEKHREGNRYNVWGYRQTYTYISPVDPKDYGIPRLTSFGHVGNAFLSAWYTDDVVQSACIDQARTPHELNMLAAVSAVHKNRWADSIRSHAAKMFRKVVSHKRPDYEEAAAMLRLCAPEEAHYLKRRLSGTKKVLLMSRKDATETDMTAGLRTLAGISSLDVLQGVSRIYGRPVTVKEIVSVRSQSLFNVLYYMPWKILEPAAKSGTKEILAHLFSVLGKLKEPERIQKCLVQHENRRSAMPYISGEEDAERIEQYVEDILTVHDWHRVFGEIEQQRQLSIRVRQALQAASGFRNEIAFLAALKIFGANNDFIDNILSRYSRYEEIQSAQKLYTVPAAMRTW